MIRHVNSIITNMLWQECYKCIRQFYTNRIVIIDDNSNSKFLTTLDMLNVEIIQSEFPKRAEILPYYYFLKFAWFDTAVILHDSMFIQKPIKFNKENCFLWHFETHRWDNVPGEIKTITKLNNYKPILELYNNKNEWFGCFGVMSVITYKMIETINHKYNYFNLLNYIKCRNDRMMLERIFGTILWYEASLEKSTCSYFGNIQTYCKWGFNEEYTIEQYNKDKELGKISLPIVKLWSGR